MQAGNIRRTANVVALALCAAAATLADPLGPAFTYQGLLHDSGLPASGRYDFEFRLFDAATDGTQMGTTVTAKGIAVSAGMFAVDLAFGETAFDGNERWLQVGVRSAASTEPFTPLSLQRPPAAPYATNLLLPFRAEVSSATSLFDITNPGPGRVAAFAQTDPLSAVHALRVEAPGGASVAAAGIYATGTGNYALFAQSENAIAGYFSSRGSTSNAPALYATTSGAGPAVRADGRLEVGSTAHEGAIDVFRSGASLATASVGSDSHGGLLLLRDPVGNNFAVLEADVDTNGGGWLALARSAGNLYGIVLEGNVAGSGNPSLTLYGTARSTTFNMNATGDAAVALPSDAISAAETLDEPGVAGSTSDAVMALSGVTESIASRSLTAPATGYVLVWGTTEATATHTTGTASTLRCGISTASGTLPTSQDHATSIPATAPSGTYSYTVSVHGVFPISAGLSTLYLVANRSSGTWSVTNTQLTALYVATAYGSVSSNLTAETDAVLMLRAALTPEEIAAEQTEAGTCEQQRIAAELVAIQARLRALESELATQHAGRPAPQPAVSTAEPPPSGAEPPINASRGTREVAPTAAHTR